MIEYLSGDEIIVAGTAACGFEPLITQPSQFHANVTRPATVCFGVELFPTIWTKAAALLHSFATTQTLADGNKRTGWASCWLMLRLNRVLGKLTTPLDSVLAEHFVNQVALGELSIDQIADTLHRFVYPQIGLAGNLPAGFRITQILMEDDQSMVGVGETPDGTPLVYALLSNRDSSISEVVMTPAEAKSFAQTLLSLHDSPEQAQTIRKFEVPVQGFLHHFDHIRHT